MSREWTSLWHNCYCIALRPLHFGCLLLWLKTVSLETSTCTSCQVFSNTVSWLSCYSRATWQSYTTDWLRTTSGLRYLRVSGSSDFSQVWSQQIIWATFLTSSSSTDGFSSISWSWRCWGGMRMRSGMRRTFTTSCTRSRCSNTKMRDWASSRLTSIWLWETRKTAIRGRLSWIVPRRNLIWLTQWHRVTFKLKETCMRGKMIWTET